MLRVGPRTFALLLHIATLHPTMQGEKVCVCERERLDKLEFATFRVNLTNWSKVCPTVCTKSHDCHLNTYTAHHPSQVQKVHTLGDRKSLEKVF